MRNWPFKVEQPGALVAADSRRYVVTKRSRWGTKQYLNASGAYGYNPVLAARFTASEADALAVDGAMKEVAP